EPVVRPTDVVPTIADPVPIDEVAPVAAIDEEEEAGIIVPVIGILVVIEGGGAVIAIVIVFGAFDFGAVISGLGALGLEEAAIRPAALGGLIPGASGRDDFDRVAGPKAVDHAIAGARTRAHIERGGCRRGECGGRASRCEQQRRGADSRFAG